MYSDGAEGIDIMLNLDDFTYSIPKSPEIDLYSYKTKAIKREEGWRIYYIGDNKTIVVDPFAENGPAIVGELPGIEE